MQHRSGDRRRTVLQTITWVSEWINRIWGNRADTLPASGFLERTREVPTGCSCNSITALQSSETLRFVAAIQAKTGIANSGSYLARRRYVFVANPAHLDGTRLYTRRCPEVGKIRAIGTYLSTHLATKSAGLGSRPQTGNTNPFPQKVTRTAMSRRCWPRRERFWNRNAETPAALRAPYYRFGQSEAVRHCTRNGKVLARDLKARG
jgi:hypothetical protein